MTGKTLIVFSTIRGLNDEAAHVIADVLKATYSMDVTVEDLGKGPLDITPFQNIIVGGGGGGKNVYDEAVDFLAKDFGGKNVALYFLCEGGETPKAGVLKPTKKNYCPKTRLSSLSTLLPLEAARLAKIEWLWMIKTRVR